MEASGPAGRDIEHQIAGRSSPCQRTIPGRSAAPLIAQLGDADAAEALPLAELTQAGDGVDHAGGSFGGRWHEPSNGTAMAGDRDLLPGAHRIEQSRQMGLGLEGANAAHGRLINQMPTSCQPVANQFIARNSCSPVLVQWCGSGRRNPGIAACVPDAERGDASISVTAPDTAGLGGPQPVARNTANPQHCSW
jgi:hypothetical protein